MTRILRVAENRKILQKLLQMRTEKLHGLDSKDTLLYMKLIIWQRQPYGPVPGL